MKSTTAVRVRRSRKQGMENDSLFVVHVDIIAVASVFSTPCTDKQQDI
jgi:hypothetical protein